MKAQKIGLVVGMNLAAACFVMQGCKAVKPETKETIPEALAVEVAPDPKPAASAPVVADTPSAPVVPEVKPLPPPAKPAPVVKPLPPPAKPAPVAAAGVVHVVSAGEVLSVISRNYNVKMSAILAANPGLNADRIRIGQKIRIPGAKEVIAKKAAPAAAAAKTTAPKRAKRAFKAYTGPTKPYVVKSGDSLGKLAQESGITIRALKEMNGLTKDTLRIGQKLKVPAEKQVATSDSKGVKAAVAAKKADVNASAKPDAKPETKAEETAKPTVVEDEKVEEAVPAVEEKKEEALPVDTPPAPPAPAEKLSTYTVKEGDDLVSISVAWGLSPSQLLNVNDIKEGEPLKPGQVLNLPPNAKRMDQ